MKVGILLWELDIAGGTQRQALHLARELARKRDDVTVYCVKGEGRTAYAEMIEGVVLRSLNCGDALPRGPRWIPRPVRRWTGNSAAVGFYREAAGRIPAGLDILNVHDYHVYPIASFWKRLTGKPVVWMMNDLPAQMGGSPGGGGPWRRLGRFLDGKTRETGDHLAYVRSFDSIVVLDNRNRDLVGRTVGTAATVIRSGVDVEAFPWTPRDPPGDGRPIRVLSNAIFYPYRRLEDIVHALVILRDRGVEFEWTHAGTDIRDRKYAESIYELVERAGISSSVRFPGEVPDDRLRDLFREADVFVFPNAPQTWGLAVFQAMACGTPTVVSRGAGASEVLADGETALLVDSYRPDQIANAIAALLGDGGLWDRLHRHGRRFVEEKIRWDLYGDRMREEFSRVLAGRVPPAAGASSPG